MIGLFTILLISGLLAKLLDSWLTKSEKDKLTEKLTGIWIMIDNSSRTSVSQAPLRVFSFVLDSLLGEKVFTARALWRTAVIATCLMVVSLSVGGIIVNTPFAVKAAPWKSFDEQFKILANYPTRLDQTIQKQKDLTPEALQYSIRQKENIHELLKYNTPTYRILYTIFLPILVLLVSSVIYVISFVMSRMMLREATEANTYLLTAAILFLNLCIGSVMAIIAILAVSAAAYPLAIIAFRSTLATLLFIPIFNIIILAGFAAALWFLGAMWIKIIATIAILPVLCLILVLFMSWLLFPLSKHLRRLLSEGLSRALEHERGIFLLVSVTFSCIGGIGVLIAKLF